MSKRFTWAPRAIIGGGACLTGLIFTKSLAGVVELRSCRDHLLTIREHLASRCIWQQGLLRMFPAIFWVMSNWPFEQVSNADLPCQTFCLVCLEKYESSVVSINWGNLVYVNCIYKSAFLTLLLHRISQVCITFCLSDINTWVCCHCDAKHIHLCHMCKAKLSSGYDSGTGLCIWSHYKFVVMVTVNKMSKQQHAFWTACSGWDNGPSAAT